MGVTMTNAAVLLSNANVAQINEQTAVTQLTLAIRRFFNQNMLLCLILFLHSYKPHPSLIKSLRKM